MISYIFVQYNNPLRVERPLSPIPFQRLFVLLQNLADDVVRVFHKFIEIHALQFVVFKLIRNVVDVMALEPSVVSSPSPCVSFAENDFRSISSTLPRLMPISLLISSGSIVSASFSSLASSLAAFLFAARVTAAF